MTESVQQPPSGSIRGKLTNSQKQTPSEVTKVKSSKVHSPKNKASAGEVQPSPRTRRNSKILQSEVGIPKAIKDIIKATVVKIKETETPKSIVKKGRNTEEIASPEVSNSPGGRRSSRKRKINPDVEAFLKGRTLQFEVEENDEQQEITDEVIPDVEKETTEIKSSKRLKRKSRNQSDSNYEVEEVSETPKRPKGEPVNIVNGAACRKSSENDREINKMSDVTPILAKLTDGVSKESGDQQPTEGVDVGKIRNTDTLRSLQESQYPQLDSSSKHEESQCTDKNDPDNSSKEGGVQRKEFSTLRDKKATHAQYINNENSDTCEENTDSNVKSETKKTASKIHVKESEIPDSRIEEILNSEPSKSPSDSNSDADNPKFNVVFDEESGNYQLTMSIDSKLSAKAKAPMAAEKVIQASEVGDLSEADEKLRDDSRAVYTCPVCRKQFLALSKFNKHVVGTNCTNVMLQGVVAAPENIRPLIEKAGKVTVSNQCPSCEKKLYCIEVSLVRL